MRDPLLVKQDVQNVRKGIAKTNAQITAITLDANLIVYLLGMGIRMNVLEMINALTNAMQNAKSFG